MYCIILTIKTKTLLKQVKRGKLTHLIINYHFQTHYLLVQWTHSLVVTRLIGNLDNRRSTVFTHVLGSFFISFMKCFG
jgi:hypothetical protein